MDGASVIDDEAARAAYQQAHEAHLGRGGGGGGGGDGGGGGGGGSGEDAGQMPDQEDMPVMNGPPRAIVPPEQLRVPKPPRVRNSFKVHFVAAVECGDIVIMLSQDLQSKLEGFMSICDTIVATKIAKSAPLGPAAMCGRCVSSPAVVRCTDGCMTLLCAPCDAEVHAGSKRCIFRHYNDSTGNEILLERGQYLTASGGGDGHAELEIRHSESLLLWCIHDCLWGYLRNEICALCRVARAAGKRAAVVSTLPNARRSYCFRWREWPRFAAHYFAEWMSAGARGVSGIV